jgi:hypothetical protein
MHNAIKSVLTANASGLMDSATDQVLNYVHFAITHRIFRENFYLPGYKAVLSIEIKLTFLRYMSPSFSELKKKPSKKLA